MKRQMKIIIPVAVCAVLIVIVVSIFLVQKYSPSKERMALKDYFKTDDRIAVIIGDEIREEQGLYQDKQVYLGLELVKSALNSRFYWDGNENLLLYSTPNAVIQTDVGSRDCYRNNSKQSREYEIVRADGGQIYIALDFVKEYTALDYAVYTDPARVVISSEFNIDKEYCKAEDDCSLRYQPDIKSEILVDLEEGAVLRLLEPENEETGFCKVMEKSGVVGYVKAKYLGDTYTEQLKTDFAEEEYTHILKKKVNLVWHQVTNQTANEGLLTLLSATKGVNVVSPTWFGTSDNMGNIDSIASDTYVAQAHQNGVEVWALCNDFSPDMKIGNVLGYTSRRQKLAKNLIAEAIRYSLDGINIDFENVKEASGEDFVQFIRELGVMCRNNGIVLSVDNYPVRDYNQYYNRTEQAAVADYVITMAYDEYYAGSEEAGPVSSLSYVQDSAAKVLEQVPAEQVIVALPFYSRHWQETTKGGKAKLSSEACSMRYAKQLVEESGKRTVWDDVAGMNYLEYTSGKVLHKMWVEDINSLELKVQAVTDKKVAGVAFWKLGLENSDVWDMIAKHTRNL